MAALLKAQQDYWEKKLAAGRGNEPTKPEKKSYSGHEMATTLGSDSKKAEPWLPTTFRGTMTTTKNDNLPNVGIVWKKNENITPRSDIKKAEPRFVTTKSDDLPSVGIDGKKTEFATPRSDIKKAESRLPTTFRGATATTKNDDLPRVGFYGKKTEVATPRSDSKNAEPRLPTIFHGAMATAKNGDFSSVGTDGKKTEVSGLRRLCRF